MSRQTTTPHQRVARCLGYAGNFGGFLSLQANEITKLHQLGLMRFEPGEAVQGVIERE
jgi:hypothetical protein